MNFLEKKIYIAGHNGLVGNSVLRALKQAGHQKILVTERQELDLECEIDVHRFLKSEKPDLVIVCAAKVGGILANNSQRTEFLFRNLKIQNNLIYGSMEADVDSLVFLGSSCIYPKYSEQPIKENQLLTGKLELTNRPYAIAKIAGLELVSSIRADYGRKYFSLMPTNLYGPGDNFDLQSSHVLPALIRRFLEACESDSPSISIWGSGSPKREFLYVDDLADCILKLIQNDELTNSALEELANDNDQHYFMNVGYGKDISIKELAFLIAEIVGFRGEILFDTSKPDGTPSKLIDSSVVNRLGWTPKTDLNSGIRKTVDWYLKQRNLVQARIRRSKPVESNSNQNEC